MSDLRYALRQLLARPGYTAIAMLTLTLGIGATTTIFSVVDHLMIDTLPFPEPERIVTLRQLDARSGAAGAFAPGNYLDVTERNNAFTAVGAADPYSYDLSGDGRPEVLLASRITEGFFPALGARAQLGRLLQPEDFRAQTAS